MFMFMDLKFKIIIFYLFNSNIIKNYNDWFKKPFVNSNIDDLIKITITEEKIKDFAF